MKTSGQVISAFLRCVLRRMKEMGVSQTALAKRMHASRPYVVKVLHGDVNITFGTALRFAHALEMDFLPQLQKKESSNVTLAEHSEAGLG